MLAIIPMLAILHNIRSMHNVGSMFRTADAAGIEKLYLTGITPAPVDEWGKARPQLIKISLGAEKTVEWEQHTSATQLIKKLQKDGYLVVAIEQHRNAILLTEFHNKISGRYFYCKLLGERIGRRKGGKGENKRGNIIFIVGNEVRGLSPAILKRTDAVVEIPMRGKKESLNVAVAFGIAAYWFLFAGRVM